MRSMLHTQAVNLGYYLWLIVLSSYPYPASRSGVLSGVLEKAQCYLGTSTRKWCTIWIMRSGDSEVVLHLLESPRNRCAIRGFPKSAALSRHPQKVLCHLGIPRRHSAFWWSQKVCQSADWLTFWEFPGNTVLAAGSTVLAAEVEIPRQCGIYIGPI